MTTGKEIALALPDEAQFRHDIQAINRFQQVVHSTMVRDLDYGVIPGTQKPTLLKPGAEKIVKLLGLSDQYAIMDKAEDWDKPFFRYLIKCCLVHVATGAVISEGMGECNSMESKYRWRWVGERDLPIGVDKSKLVTQERHNKSGGHWTVYRLDNEDIFSQVNTIIKMAKKRALVDAALSAGRLSDVFTQDIEDLPSSFSTETPAQRARIAPEALPEAQNRPSPPSTEQTGQIGQAAPQQPIESEKELRDMAWFKESLETLQWADVGKYLRVTYGVTGQSKSEMISALSPEQREAFSAVVKKRLERKT